MRQAFIVSLGVIGVLGLGACGSSRRGGAGESCTSTDDCEDGLGCFGQLCVAAASGGTTARTDGVSCTARRDCAAGLACVENSCQTMSVGMGDASTRYSGKGESCQVTNDCASGLSCVMNMCRSLSVSLPALPKTCVRVECENKQDCCQNFVPNVNCPTYEMNCAMDPIFCNTFRSLCQCSQDCVDELCVTAAPGCKSNAECTSSQTPFCVEGKCRQCDKDAACAGMGSKCSQGVCMAACRQDEHCPLLHECQNGVCVETGCKSDRECAFMSREQLAVCVDGECEVPCDSDAECMGSTETRGFERCEMGKCVFVGCETNKECRALLGLENQRGNVQAVCRERKASDSRSSSASQGERAQ